MPIDLFLVGAPLTGAIGTLGALGWRHEMFRRFQRDLSREQARRAQLLQGAARLRPAWEDWSQGSGVGQMPLLVVGTAAADQLPSLLEGFVRAGPAAAASVGPILLAEPEVDSRDRCLKAIPDAFRRRVTELHLRLLPEGLRGRTVQEALAPALTRCWTGDLHAAVAQWLSVIRRTAQPGRLLALISPGGSGVLGRAAIDAFKAEYPQADVYVGLVLDHKTDRRELNLPPLLDLYEEGSAVTGFLIGDNRLDATRFDQALALLFPGMVAATWTDHQRQSGFNVLGDVFRTHRVATLRAWAGWLPVHYLEPWKKSLPALYFTSASFAESQILHGVDAVRTDPTLQSLALPAADHPTFIYAIGPIRPDPDLRELAARVRANLVGELDSDTTLSFASLGHPCSPTSEQAPIAVVSLFPVMGGLGEVRRLVTDGAAPQLQFVVQPVPPMSRVGGTSSDGR